MLDASLIILIGFLVFMAFAFRFGYRKSIKALDSKIDEIKALLDTAELAKKQSQAQIEKEKTFADHAHVEIATLKQSVDQQIADIQKQAALELDHLLSIKSENAKLILERLRTQAIHQLKEEITDAAVNLIKTIANHELKPAEHEQVNQHFIDMLDKISANKWDNGTKKKLDPKETEEKHASNF